MHVFVKRIRIPYHFYQNFLHIWYTSCAESDTVAKFQNLTNSSFLGTDFTGNEYGERDDSIVPKSSHSCITFDLIGSVVNKLMSNARLFKTNDIVF